MLRLLSALVFLVLAIQPAALSAAPGDEEPKYDNKTVSEWVAMLDGSREIGQRRLALHALGAAADHSLVWRQTTKNRRGALLVLYGILGPAKSKKVLPALVAALQKDPEDIVRADAARGLGLISAKCVAEKQDFSPGREALFGALRTDPSGSVRAEAATALAKLNPGDVQAAVPTLIERLKDPYPPARDAAASTLFKLGRDAVEAVTALREAVEDEKNERTTRVWCTQALGKIGPPEASVALPALQKVLADDKAPLDIRKAIMEVMAKFGKDAGPAVPLLAKLLTDEGSLLELRSAAVAALDQLGPNAVAAIPALKKAAKDKDKFVRYMAVRSFASIGKELGSETKEVVVLLRQATDDPLLEVRFAAIDTLGNLGAAVLGDDVTVVRERLKQLERERRERRARGRTQTR